MTYAYEYVCYKCMSYLPGAWDVFHTPVRVQGVLGSLVLGGYSPLQSPEYPRSTCTVYSEYNDTMGRDPR